jgi:hypothetical protein
VVRGILGKSVKNLAKTLGAAFSTAAIVAYSRSAIQASLEAQAQQQRLETLLEGAYINAGRATPPRVSRKIASQNTSPIIAPQVNPSANTPAANAPKFLGFEPKPTGQ